MKPETHLLRLIAKVPADEKLPIAAMARIIGASQSVVVAMIQALIAEGRLDATTVRPPLAVGKGMAEPREACHEKRGRGPLSAAPIVAEIDAFLATGAMSKTAFALQCLKSHTALPRLRKDGASVRAATAARIRAFIQEHTPGAATPSAPASAGAERPAKPSAPALPDRPTGDQLVEAIEQAARDAGVPLCQFILPLVRDTQKLEQMRDSRRPLRSTVERVRALIAGKPVPEPRGAPPVVPQQFVRRSEREASGLPPSRREIDEARALAVAAARRDREGSAREAAERATASRRPGETVAEAVKREAETRVARRTQARCTGSVVRPLSIEGVGDVTAARRSREFADVATPSALIRRATAEWPDKCAAVKALADEIGVSLAEAWQRVIAAGIDCLTDPEAV